MSRYHNPQYMASMLQMIYDDANNMLNLHFSNKCEMKKRTYIEIKFLKFLNALKAQTVDALTHGRMKLCDYENMRYQYFRKQEEKHLLRSVSERIAIEEKEKPSPKFRKVN